MDFGDLFNFILKKKKKKLHKTIDRVNILPKNIYQFSGRMKRKIRCKSIEQFYGIIRHRTQNAVGEYTKYQQIHFISLSNQNVRRNN